VVRRQDFDCVRRKDCMLWEGGCYLFLPEVTRCLCRVKIRQAFWEFGSILTNTTFLLGRFAPFSKPGRKRVRLSTCAPYSPVLPRQPARSACTSSCCPAPPATDTPNETQLDSFCDLRLVKRLMVLCSRQDFLKQMRNGQAMAANVPQVVKSM
jgi:hypothetical protein